MAEKNSVPGDSSRCTRDGGSNGQTPSLSPTHGQRSRLDTHSTRCVCACVCAWQINADYSWFFVGKQ